MVCLLAVTIQCISFVWTYIVKQCINKKFVNLFYVVAFTLLGVDTALIVFTYLSMPLNKGIKLSDPIPQGTYEVIFALQSIFYFSLTLLIISTCIHISLGLKQMINIKNCTLNQIHRQMYYYYGAILFSLACAIAFELTCIFSDVVTYLVYWLVEAIIGLALITTFIVSLKVLLKRLKELDSPVLDDEKKKIVTQTFLFALSLLIFTLVRFSFLFGVVTELQTLLLVVQASLPFVHILPMVYTVKSH